MIIYLSDRLDLDARPEPISFADTVGRAVQEDRLQRPAQEEEPGLQVHVHAGRDQGGKNPPLPLPYPSR